MENQTSDLHKYANFIVTAISTAVNKAIPKSKSERSESNPISDETIAGIKDKRRFSRQYSQNKDPAVKTRINQLQKQVKDDIRVETQAGLEKLYNSVSLEKDQSESWHKIKNFLKPKGSARLSNTAPQRQSHQEKRRQTQTNADKHRQSATLVPNLSKDTSA